MRGSRRAGGEVREAASSDRFITGGKTTEWMVRGHVQLYGLRPCRTVCHGWQWQHAICCGTQTVRVLVAFCLEAYIQ
ncbi:hypothetical protein F441_23158 [Phytophthora nicotianae CJ01A1]|uniref:Uncharacterized protein n=2 Tax=Phytophthora nicotianae TaxID=4792 RepID=W2VPS1_PHYNI|nr:hypothetical protein F444_03836 [Phytophthora nicotianae P1976]ETO99428.1 hypothetical protein F441_23158 [Phytophthora nicotianae CJ01A1]